MADEKKTKPAADQDQAPQPRRFRRYCLVLLLTGAVLLCWLSLLTYCATDPPSAYMYDTFPHQRTCQNAVGRVGAYLAYGLRYWIGGGAYMGLALLTVAAGVMLAGKRISDWRWRAFGGVLLVLATCSALSLGAQPAVRDVAEGPTGIIGLAIGRFVLSRFSTTGSAIVLAVVFCVGSVLVAEEVLTLAWSALRGLAHRKLRPAVDIPIIVGRPARVAAAAAPQVEPAAKPLPARVSPPRAASPAEALGAKKPVPPPAQKPAPEDEPARPAAEDPSAPAAPAPPAPAAKPTAPPLRLVPAKDRAASKPKSAPAKPRLPGLFDLPSLDLLAPPQGGYSETAEAQAAQRRLVLQQTLDDFNVEATVTGYETGPVITLFEVALSPGVKVSQIGSLATDIARTLAVPGVRIVPPRFGKDTVGIEVPNLDKEIVRIRELMDLAPNAPDKMSLPLYLGKDAGGGPIIADLAGMPHLLIAGTTGSGKSICINAIIISMLMVRRPEDVRLILVDPKMVEMAAFEQIPHLLCPIVNDMRKAEEILEWAATKMDERYDLLREANVKNIAGYNRLGEAELYKRFQVESDEEKARIPKRLPYYVIIIDELADLIMTADKEVESHIIRIAQKARAVGIHLILATQRPSVNVVTGLIKSNMPCRVSFRVASRQESRIVLDQNGAEVLLGRGDMLFLEPGSSSLTRAQGTYVDDSEIHAVVDAIREGGEPQFHPELIRLNARPAGETDGEKDDLFDKAVEIVLATERGSVSLLQRRLQVGYTRASRIIDQMAEAGILGDYKGSQARECLLTLEDWRSLQESIHADQSGASAVNGEPTSV